MRQLSVFILGLLLFVSCGSRRKETIWKNGPGTRTELRYARNIIIERANGYTVVRLINPWKQNAILHTYYLVDRDSRVDIPDDGTIVTVPLRRSVVFTTAHASLLEMLHAQKAIAGVADLKYMVIPDIQKRTRLKDGIADCGNAMQPDVERVIDLHADAILLSPFENSGGYGRLEETGIPIIECADYMETSPLGRAEWMKFYGLLFGCEQTADSLFMEVEKNYMELTEAAKKEHERPTILTEKLTGTVWYVPGGQSTMGRMIADAGATYPFSDNKQSGSLALPLEKVLEEARSADIWLIKYNAPTPLTYSQMLGENKGYAMIKAFKTRRVYGCNAAIKPIFEETPFRPDWLLQELIRIAHPSKQPFVGRYFEPLN